MTVPQRDQWILLGIFALALFLRLAHLLEIQANDPFFSIPAVDGAEYHARALAIARGDLVGEGVIFLGPFYPWFMALIYALFGPSLYVLKLVQAALGAIDCLLVFALARICFDRTTSLLAAAGTAVYGMLVFYGGTVMIVNVMVPLVLLATIASVRALQAPAAWRFGLAGLAVSAATLARQNLLLFAVLLLPWIFFALRDRVSLARRAGFAAAFGLGLALLILPFTLRNWLVADDFVLLNSTGGISLYMGNNGRANGAWVPPDFGPRVRVDNPRAMQSAFEEIAERHEGRQLKPSEVSGYWRGRAVDWVLENPARWFELEVRKLLLFFNAREIWNNRSIDVSRDFSWVLRLPLLPYAVLAPLALLGMGLARARWRELFPLYAMVVVFVASGLLFFVLSRYRMGVVPILLVFGAHAVARLIEHARARAWRPVGLALAWLLVLGVIVQRDMGKENLFMAYFNLGNKYRDLGRYEEAIAAYDKSLAISPNFVATHNNQALAYESLGRTEDAVYSWRTVYRWAEATGDARRYATAARHLKKLLDLPDDWQPGDPDLAQDPEAEAAGSDEPAGTEAVVDAAPPSP